MNADAPLPWYRYFWPWFIVLLVATAVVASIVTLFIAIESQDSLVRDDWYQDGTEINRRLERAEAARRLGVTAILHIDESASEIRLELQGQSTDDVRALRLEFSHPTQVERDQVLILNRGAGGEFRGSIGEPLQGRRYLALAPAGAGSVGQAEGAWALSGVVSLPSQGPLTLAAEP